LGRYMQKSGTNVKIIAVMDQPSPAENRPATPPTVRIGPSRNRFLGWRGNLRWDREIAHSLDPEAYNLVPRYPGLVLALGSAIMVASLNGRAIQRAKASGA